MIFFAVEKVHRTAKAFIQGSHDRVHGAVHRLGNGSLFFFGEFAEYMADQTIACWPTIIRADADLDSRELIGAK